MITDSFAMHCGLTVWCARADVPQPPPVRREVTISAHPAATAVPTRVHAPSGHAADGASSVTLPQWPALLNAGPVPCCTTSLWPARLWPVPPKPGEWSWPSLSFVSCFCYTFYSCPCLQLEWVCASAGSESVGVKSSYPQRNFVFIQHQDVS